MSNKYPGYDVLAKRHTPSWNEKTRQVIDERIAIPRTPRFLNATEWANLDAICQRITPQPSYRPPIPVAAMVDGKLFANTGDGFRDARIPPLREAWRLGLQAFDAEARLRHQLAFAVLAPTQQDALLRNAQDGQLRSASWRGMDCALFFAQRLLPDIVMAYYSHPTSWSEIGFGGPASPRGYVRMDFDRRDPWEAAEAGPGQEQRAKHENARIG